MTMSANSRQSAATDGSRSAARRHHSRRACRGLTLVELMVALAVFAVLGTLTYRGTNAMFASAQHIEQELERWREINRAFQIIESELFQVVAPQTKGKDASTPPMSLHVGTGSQELRFLSLAGGAPERIGFVFDRQRIDWTRQTMTADTPKERDTLIDNITGLRWLFLSKSGWVEAWPIDGEPGDEALPAAIGLELTLPQIGTVNRIYALR